MSSGRLCLANGLAWELLQKSAAALSRPCLARSSRCAAQRADACRIELTWLTASFICLLDLLWHNPVCSVLLKELVPVTPT